MSETLNIKRNPYYQKRNHTALPKRAVSKKWLAVSSIGDVWFLENAELDLNGIWRDAPVWRWFLEGYVLDLVGQWEDEQYFGFFLLTGELDENGNWLDPKEYGV